MDTPNSSKLTKEQRKSLYKWWWSYYNEFGADGRDYDNPNKDNQIYSTQQWLTPGTGDLSPAYYLASEILDKYRPKFVLWAQKRVKKNGGWPKEEKRTRVIYSFLRRGFVHISDIDTDPKKYYVVSLIGELVYPKAFDQHGEACECSKKRGIPGYTKCPIPK